MATSVKQNNNSTKELRRKLNEIIVAAEEKSKKSDLTYEQFIKVAREAGKTFTTDERANSAEGFIF